jgi:mRNA interferase MazF
LTRGDIWTSAGRGAYAGKPRPVVIIQHRHFIHLDSVTACGFTTDAVNAPLFRVLVQATAENGLDRASRIMADKIMTFPKAKLGRRIGRLDEGDLVRLNQALRVFLGLAD